MNPPVSVLPQSMNVALKQFRDGRLLNQLIQRYSLVPTVFRAQMRLDAGHRSDDGCKVGSRNESDIRLTNDK